MWRNGKHVFHAVLYISWNFLQTFIVTDMAECPPVWDGGCQTLNICGVLAISCNSQHKSFLVNWAQTPCGGWGIQNISFTFH